MRIAIVNDMPMAVEALRRAIQSDAGNDIAWTAWNGAEAVERCANDTPDLILMDLIMPEVNGVEATEKIMQSSPCPILIVTASVAHNSNMVFEAMGKGAIDAINTPLFAGGGETDGQKSLLRKISMIAVLTKSAPKYGESDKKIPFSRSTGSEGLVVIGSSSGGPKVLAEILNALPKDFPAAVIIVQHVDEQFSQGLAQWLDQQTELPVRIAQKGDKPEKGKVFLAGTNDHLVMMDNGELQYQAEPKSMPYRPSVDVFWHSLCQYATRDITAILLTGMGKDGAQGMLELKQQGAYTIAQDEKSCTVYGMPKAAVDMNAVTDVFTVDEIINKLRSKYALKLQG